MARLAIVNTHMSHANMRLEEKAQLLILAMPKWLSGQGRTYHEEHVLRHVLDALRTWEPPSDNEVEGIVASAHGIAAPVASRVGLDWKTIAAVVGLVAVFGVLKAFHVL